MCIGLSARFAYIFAASLGKSSLIVERNHSLSMDHFNCSNKKSITLSRTINKKKENKIEREGLPLQQCMWPLLGSVSTSNISFRETKEQNLHYKRKIFNDVSKNLENMFNVLSIFAKKCW